ncbi:MAG TPA: trypsin-like peptidase domain-containing protein [Geopsychrobacteraceae bacterium]|nr:trypsin-like peptidase domain-containing protein [Geopsychrobacteraceae bacterium]
MTRIFILLLLLSFVLPHSIILASERRTPVVEAVAKARRAVVNIRTEQIVHRRNSPFFGFGDSMFEQFFNDMLAPRSYKTQSLGSGVVIDNQGHILTNAHVIDKASKIYVALPDRVKELEATLIGQDNRIDLAVLKIEGSGEFPFLKPARSDDVLLGETVIAIGNPLGLGHSITTGIISSAQRRIQLDQGQSTVFIQTDALINPGNSGGPLININGDLIGINTAIARQAQGIGFSIPIDTAKRVVADLIDYGRVRRAFFGIVPGDVGRNFIRTRGEGGVLVEKILPDSPAHESGVRVADVVIAIDGIPLTSKDDFYSSLATYTPDDRMTLTVLRGLGEITLQVQLSVLPEGYVMAYTRELFGFSLLQSRSGLQIDSVDDGSPADLVGIKVGDLIIKVAGYELDTLDQFIELMGQLLGREPLEFLVARNNRGYLVELP